MFTYNGTAVLQFDSPVTGNAGSGVTVTVRGASTPVAGQGNLISIYDFNGLAIPNPLTTDSRGNYTFKAIDGFYDIVLSEGNPTQVILPGEQFLDLHEFVIGSVSEEVILADGQTTVTFLAQTTNGADFHINGLGLDSRLLDSTDVNLPLTTETTITLFDSYPSGSIVTLSKNTGTGQEPIARAFVHNEPTLNGAIISLNLAVGDAINLAERTTGNGGGAMWDVVLSTGVTENGDNIVQCTGVPTLSLVRRDDWGSVGNLSQAYEFDTVALMKASTIVFPLGKVLKTKGYYATGDVGGNDYEIVAAGTGTDDGGSYIDLTASGLQVKGLFPNGHVTVEQFSAIGDYNPTLLTGKDNLAALQNSANYLYENNGGELVFRSGYKYYANKYFYADVNGKIIMANCSPTEESRVLVVGSNTKLRSDGEGYYELYFRGGSHSGLGFGTSANILVFSGQDDSTLVTSATSATKSVVVTSAAGLSIGMVVNLFRIGGAPTATTGTPSAEKSPQQFLTISAIAGTTITFREDFYVLYDAVQDLKLSWANQQVGPTHHVAFDKLRLFGFRASSESCYFLISQSTDIDLGDILLDEGCEFSYGMCERVRTKKIRRIYSDIDVDSSITHEATHNSYIEQFEAIGNGNTSNLGAMLINDNTRNLTIEKYTASGFLQTGFTGIYGVDITVNEMYLDDCGTTSTWDGGVSGAVVVGHVAEGSYASRTIAEYPAFKVRNEGLAKVHIKKLIHKNGAAAIPVRYHDCDLRIDYAEIEWEPSNSRDAVFYGGASGDRRADATYFPDGGVSTLRLGEVHITSATGTVANIFSGANGYTGMFKGADSFLTSPASVGDTVLNVDQTDRFRPSKSLFAVNPDTDNPISAFQTVQAATDTTITLTAPLTYNLATGAGVFGIERLINETTPNVYCDKLFFNGVRVTPPNALNRYYPNYVDNGGQFEETLEVTLPNFGIWQLTVTNTSLDESHAERKVFNIMWDDTVTAFPLEAVSTVDTLTVRVNATVKSATVDAGVVSVVLGSGSIGKSSACSYVLSPLELTLTA